MDDFVPSSVLFFIRFASRWYNLKWQAYIVQYYPYPWQPFVSLDFRKMLLTYIFLNSDSLLYNSFPLSFILILELSVWLVLWQVNKPSWTRYSLCLQWPLVIKDMNLAWCVLLPCCWESVGIPQDSSLYSWPWMLVISLCWWHFRYHTNPTNTTQTLGWLYCTRYTSDLRMPVLIIVQCIVLEIWLSGWQSSIWLK